MKPRLSPDGIMAAVARDMGTISMWEPVAEGEESQAFAVRLDDDACIVRVNRSAEGFRKDDFCHRRFASSDLSIPEIISIGVLDEAHAYCVSRRAPGITLQDTALSDLPSTAEPVMRVMEAMAGADIAGTSGYGPFDENGTGRYANWVDFIMSIANPSSYDWEALKPRLDNRRVASYLRVLEASAQRCPDVRRLVHGDFGSNNVLTEGGRITGVIDWSEAMFGDPLYDTANLFFWRSWLDCMEVQAQHIENRHPELARQEALHGYQLRIGLDVIYHSAAAGSRRELEWALARCDESAARLT